MPPRAARTHAFTTAFRHARALLTAAALAWLPWLAACSSPGAAAAAPFVTAATAATAEAASDLRLLIQLNPAIAPDAAPAAAITAWASRSAGVPVRYAAAAGASWHAVVLACRPADCDAALQRLAADHSHFEHVERDALRRAAR